MKKFLISLLFATVLAALISTTPARAQYMKDLGSYTAAGPTDSLKVGGTGVTKFMLICTGITSYKVYMEEGWSTAAGRKWTNASSIGDTLTITPTVPDSTDIIKYTGDAGLARLRITSITGALSQSIRVIARYERK